MNAQFTAQRAYAQTAGSLRTPRGQEYDAFARVTHQMIAADTTKAMAPLAAALHRNRRLWTLLASDVADPANQLPAALRAQIFYLAEFTSQHSRKVLRGAATAAPLIEVNRAIMRGLRPQEATE
ncbi:flagellar biosynthesis regulator FlaF [Thalassovita sp.]|uniref:flagellar biosynthesis regulator FlaF n=1 Tax=Thalassovita sp. TaxID=1979401 RepID=UPI0029DE5963|nr:flagellar biosynthesis regulator FlaF [Thalassovita sp.]